METLHAIVGILFCFFLYSQLAFQYKIGDELTLYEIDYTTNAELNNCANIKQPFIFNFAYNSLLQNLSLAELVNNYAPYEVLLKEENDYYALRPERLNIIPLSLSAVNTLIQTEAAPSNYFSWNNKAFIYESGLLKHFKQYDVLLQTPLCVSQNYDIIFGSQTPLAYHTFERRYLYAVGGNVKIKLTSWRSSKYITIDKLYKPYEFVSPLNVWEPQPQYETGFHKIKFLDIVLPQGHMLFLPPYWFYSMRMDKNTVLYEFNYGSIMNVVSNVKNLTLHVYNKFELPLFDGHSTVSVI
jgi:hypothetical protein